MEILLASGSPRRHELLTTAQLSFTTMSVDIDETPYPSESPQDYIHRMVATKAAAAVEALNDKYHHSVASQTIHTTSPALAAKSSFLILTADTIGVLADGKTVLVKPTDRDHAYAMWQQMSDNTHQVWTAVQATVVTILPAPDSTPNSQYPHHRPLQVSWQQHIIECTDVNFVPLTPDMMASYWDSGEPADKAGGYGIQGLAAAWVSDIKGSYTNVVGLPLAQTLALITHVKHHHSMANAAQ